MAASVQVVLTQEVSHLGHAGDLVKVKPGYARNFLIPRQMAVHATQGNVKQIEHERRAALARAAKLREEASELAGKLGAITVEVRKPAGEGGKLYGSVTNKDIAAALKQHGFDIERKKLQLPDTIKEEGEYEITAKVAPEVNATFKLIVLPE